MHGWTLRGAGRVGKSKLKWMIHMIFILFVATDWKKLTIKPFHLILIKGVSI